MYSRSTIYKLQCDDGHFYYGSTCNNMRIRFSQHKSTAKRVNLPVYQHINQLGWDKARMILVEEFSCETKAELLKRENEYIQKERENPLCLNANSAVKDPDYARQYYLDNKKTRLDWQHEYYNSHKERAREYYQKNREKLLAYQKAYYTKKKTNDTPPSS